MRSVVFILVGFLFLAQIPSPAEGRVFTLWPALDYRHSETADYTSVHLLGPFIKYERKGTEREMAVRPLYFRAWDTDEEIGLGEVLYPVGSGKSSSGRTSWQGLHLLQYDFGQRELGSDNEFMLFPFLFAGETEEQGSYFALFPIGGRLYDKFGRDEIRFALFPLYGQTQKKGTTITNVLWPIFASIRGENERGTKVWPLFGSSEKEGVYRKRFFLWPIFFHEDLNLDRDNPRYRRGAFPFYLQEESLHRTSKTVLWPFFHYRHDREKGVEEWDLPWPLVRISQGSKREGGRFLPFYSDEKTDVFRKRWYLWPIYRIEEFHSEAIDRRRDRVLFFLFSRLEEKKRETAPALLHRVDLWPLFSYERKNGVTLFHTFSLLEPFFPQNESIRRNWSPLWRVYQATWDTQGNGASTLLWNLYWRERRGDDVAMELFPLFEYAREEDKGIDLRLLKGLFRFSSGPAGHQVRLLFLPWGIVWGNGDDRSSAGGA